MFKGSHPITIDAKGRIAIPASYRQSLMDECLGRLVVTPHWDKCLLIYPQHNYEKFQTQLLAMGGMDPEVREVQRLFIGQAGAVEMDRQGRLLLPSKLRGDADLGSKAVLSGMGNLFELWDEAEFYRRDASTRENLAAKAANGQLPAALQNMSF